MKYQRSITKTKGLENQSLQKKLNSYLICNQTNFLFILVRKIITSEATMSQCQSINIAHFDLLPLSSLQWLHHFLRICVICDERSKLNTCANFQAIDHWDSLALGHKYSWDYKYSQHYILKIQERGGGGGSFRRIFYFDLGEIIQMIWVFATNLDFLIPLSLW